MLRLPRFVRRYIRRKMHPMAEDDAWSMKTRLSVLYAVIAWNAFGFVAYQCFSGHKNWPVSKGIRDPKEDIARPAYQWAKTLGKDKADVVRVHSISDILNAKVDKIVVQKEEEKPVVEGDSEELLAA